MGSNLNFRGFQISLPNRISDKPRQLQQGWLVVMWVTAESATLRQGPGSCCYYYRRQPLI